MFIRDIPRLTIEMRPEARRFITMIDTLYDHQVKLVCSAEVPPEQLFAAKPVKTAESKEAMVLTDDLDIQQVRRQGPCRDDWTKSKIRPATCFASTSVVEMLGNW